MDIIRGRHQNRANDFMPQLAIYTKVAICKLKEVNEKTHPARSKPGQEYE